MRQITLCFLLVIPMAAAWSGKPSGNQPNQQAVAEVASGQRPAANAAWWGFGAEDSTDFLQAAIDSKASKIVVPYMGADWIVRPLKLRSGIEINFEPGVVVMAKKGQFLGKGDSLFSGKDAHDIVLRGYGATLRMRKTDYQNPPYEKAEWRMALDFVGCSRINVEGLHLESSGGDGIYLGCSARQPFCENVLIRDVVCHDNHRQGISVIGAKNLLIENCMLSATDGTAPRAGIDIEPNQAAESLVNCLVRDCIMDNNAGAGILVYLTNLTKASEPLSVRFENCYIRGGKDTAIGVGAIKDDGPKGSVVFKHCTMEGAAKGGLYLYDKSADSARVTFDECHWKDVGIGPSRESYAPLLLHLSSPNKVAKLGGVDFINCHVYDSLNRPVLEVETGKAEQQVSDIKGAIFCHNPHDVNLKLPPNSAALELKAIAVR